MFIGVIQVGNNFIVHLVDDSKEIGMKRRVVLQSVQYMARAEEVSPAPELERYVTKFFFAFGWPSHYLKMSPNEYDSLVEKELVKERG